MSLFPSLAPYKINQGSENNGTKKNKNVGPFDVDYVRENKIPPASFFCAERLDSDYSKMFDCTEKSLDKSHYDKLKEYIFSEKFLEDFKIEMLNNSEESKSRILENSKIEEGYLSDYFKEYVILCAHMYVDEIRFQIKYCSEDHLKSGFLIAKREPIPVFIKIFEENKNNILPKIECEGIKMRSTLLNSMIFKIREDGNIIIVIKYPTRNSGDQTVRGVKKNFKLHNLKIHIVLHDTKGSDSFSVYIEEVLTLSEFYAETGEISSREVKYIKRDAILNFDFAPLEAEFNLEVLNGIFDCITYSEKYKENREPIFRVIMTTPYKGLSLDKYIEKTISLQSEKNHPFLSGNPFLTIKGRCRLIKDLFSQDNIDKFVFGCDFKTTNICIKDDLELSVIDYLANMHNWATFTLTTRRFFSILGNRGVFSIYGTSRNSKWKYADENNHIGESVPSSSSEKQYINNNKEWDLVNQRILGVVVVAYCIRHNLRTSRFREIYPMLYFSGNKSKALRNPEHIKKEIEFESDVDPYFLFDMLKDAYENKFTSSIKNIGNAVENVIKIILSKVEKQLDDPNVI
jgi:hypothetical protein